HLRLAVCRLIGEVTAMAIGRRRVDRAQRFRARRIWWDRHGAFMRGVVTGAALCALVMWITQVANTF
ncbi:hypothetical protein, partial [Phenylobacterium sp.]|uniref:hypothetical protein n=1 Tax=Phenylobacterium sp. TaxID=1871053 RepID=UPI002734FA79